MNELTLKISEQERAFLLNLLQQDLVIKGTNMAKAVMQLERKFETAKPEVKEAEK